MIVQFGGQTPLKLAQALEQPRRPILGTSVDSIDLAEDRDRFKRLLDKLGLKQPKNGIAYSVEQSRLVAGELGLPLVVRPSYVLGGRAMAIIHDQTRARRLSARQLPSLVPADVKARYPNDKTGQINTVLGKNPLLFDRYLVGRDRGRRRRARRRQGRRSSPASWSISRRPASIPATRLFAAAALADAEMIAELERQTASSRWRSRSAA